MAQQYDRPTSLKARDAFSAADDIVYTLMYGDVDESLDDDGKARCEIARRGAETDNPYELKAARLMLFDLLLEHPEATATAIQCALHRIREELAAATIEPTPEEQACVERGKRLIAEMDMKEIAQKPPLTEAQVVELIPHIAEIHRVAMHRNGAA